MKLGASNCIISISPKLSLHININITNSIFSQIELLYIITTTFLLLHIKPTVQRHAAQLICLTISMRAHQSWGNILKMFN